MLFCRLAVVVSGLFLASCTGPHSSPSTPATPAPPTQDVEAVRLLEKQLAEEKAKRVLAEKQLAAKKAQAKVDEQRAIAAQQKAEDKRLAQEEERRKRIRREYDLLPELERYTIDIARTALKGTPIDKLQNKFLITINTYPNQFDVERQPILEALAVYGDNRKAGEHIALLGITKPEQVFQCRVGFGMLDGPHCWDALLTAQMIKERGLSNLPDQLKDFIRLHPKLFPVN